MAITKIQSESLNLADDFAFTGTITGAGESNVPAFQAILSSTQTITNSTYTKVQYNTEIFDTDNVYDNSTNYRFTVPSNGKYFLYSGNYCYDAQNAEAIAYMDIAFYKNGSQFHRLSNDNGNAKSITSDFYNISATVNASTNDYFEVYIKIGQKNGINPQVIGGSSIYHSWFGGFKITT